MVLLSVIYRICHGTYELIVEYDEMIIKNQMFSTKVLKLIC